MRYINKILKICLAAVVLMTSCADFEQPEYDVTMPASLAEVEYLKSIDSLKSYVDRAVNPNFKIGAGTVLTDYTGKGVMYRLLTNNFDEITLMNEMKHTSIVQADGSMNFGSLAVLVLGAKNAGIDVFGYPLVWHTQQRAAYLNSLIAGVQLGTKTHELMTNGDVEGDDMATSYQWTGNTAPVFTADGEGKDGTGRGVAFTCAAVGANTWDTQIWIKFPAHLETGRTYRLSLDVRADVNNTVGTQWHNAPGSYISGASNINFTTSWATFTTTFTPTNATIQSLAFNLAATATTYYIDNVSFTWDEPIFDDKTPAEKDEIITAEMDRWISGVMAQVKDGTKSWVVVNEPMSDTNPSELRTGIGLATVPADAFYWQDYLGKNYAVKAIQMARQHGNPDDKLFINDSGLESNLDKCRGLIEYVKYIDSQGVRVDGIGTQMHINLQTNRDDIVEMFKLLAATGKLIKVTELDLGMGAGITTPNATSAQLHQQAEYYQFVVEKYFEHIPAAQRAGITIWSPLDTPDSNNAAWRRNEPIGLWTRGYLRKHAFSGVANGLAGRDISAGK